MARRRRRHKRRRGGRSEAARLAARLHDYAMERSIGDNLEYEAHKANQSKYLAEIARLEQEILRRTVFVTNVKDLKQPQNLLLLRTFFQEHYGPVEVCVRADFNRGKKKNHNFPPGRVRFLLEDDARKIFGGKDLLHALRDKDVKELTCQTVGHLGFLHVRPSTTYRGILDNVSIGNSAGLQITMVHLGHWFPTEEDSFGGLVEDTGVAQEDTEADPGNVFIEEASINERAELRIDMNARQVELRFQRLSHMVSFRFKDLRGSMELCTEHNLVRYSLVFRLKYPPRVFRLDTVDGREVPSRCLEFNGVPVQTIGSCWGYKLDTSGQAARSLLLDGKTMSKMKNFGLINADINGLSDASIICTIMADPREAVEVSERLRSVKDRRLALLVKSIIDQGLVSPYHCIRDKDGRQKSIFCLVDTYISSGSTTLAGRTLEKMASFTRPTRYPAKLFRHIASLEETDDLVDEAIPSYCIETARIIVTPTRTAVVGLYVEMSNRVVRHFTSKVGFEAARFLRVSIAEENGSQLQFDQLTPPVCLQIESGIVNGIVLNGNNYRFLAYSSSQLKESSLWMVDAKYGWTVPRMREWMGDFSSCSTPSKYAARMGQCFSTTFVTEASRATQRHRSLSTLDNFPDISNGNKMCHSDGTGLICEGAMNTLLEGLPIRPKDVTDVSIIQVRYGGAKGTLTRWNFSALKRWRSGSLHSRAQRYDVLLRPSMVKFKAPYAELEVVSIGRHVPYYLNRNVILLLGVHRVPDSVFLNAQRQMLDDLDEMLVNAEKAITLVPRLSGPDSTLSSTLVHMLGCGLCPRSEPFLFGCLHAIRGHHLSNLRKKSRIFVEKGAVLIGGIDETGLVPEGCVFVQIRPSGLTPERDPRPKTAEFEVLTGPVMATKHPVVHPGDVRMLLSVDIPELHMQKNVVLFSRHGMRPEADKMSGSDLDGDQFAVTWDSRYFLGSWNGAEKLQDGSWRNRSGQRLSCRQHSMENDVRILGQANRDPMDFSESVQVLASTDIPLQVIGALESLGLSTFERLTDENSIPDEELVRHFINHTKSANIGRIASMWLDYAAWYGADCEQCLALAKLHSIAVDFPKSGIPAVIPPDLVIPRGMPRAHWRERKDAQEYHCTSILGRLYDQVVTRIKKGNEIAQGLDALAGRKLDGHGQVLCFVDRHLSLHDYLDRIFVPRVCDRLALDINSNEDYLLFASQQCARYEDHLMTLMSKYKLHSEGELLTGCIRKYHRLSKRRQHDLSEEVRRQCRELRKSERSMFFTQVLYKVCPHLDPDVNDTDNDAAEITEAQQNGQELDHGQHGDDTDDEQSSVDSTDDFLEAARLEWVERAVLLLRTDPKHENPGFSNQELDAFRESGKKLAAAYYAVTYNPEMRWHPSTSQRALFSFPWVVADVICSGIRQEI